MELVNLINIITWCRDVPFNIYGLHYTYYLPPDFVYTSVNFYKL